MTTKTMSRNLYILLLALALPFSSFGSENKSIFLTYWKKQEKPVDSRSLRLDFRETINTLEHDFDPWKLTTRTAKGSVWINENQFCKSDTLNAEGRTYYSKTVLNDTTLLFQDYGDDGLFDVTQSMVAKQIIQSARYSPMLIIQHFMEKHQPKDDQQVEDDSKYELTIGGFRVVMNVNHTLGQVLSITVYSYDELYGDVSTMYEYSDYSWVDKIPYPQTIKTTSLGGKIVDEVHVTGSFVKNKILDLLVLPDNYKLKPDEIAAPQVRVQKYNDHIYFVELLHTDDRIMIVEFADFLLRACWGFGA